MKKKSVIAVVIVLLIMICFYIFLKPIVSRLTRKDAFTAMQEDLEKKYGESFTVIEESKIYSSPGILNSDPTKRTYSAEFKCESLPYFHVNCSAQLNSDKITYTVRDNYNQQLERYKYRAIMIENIKGIFPDGSYVWVDYSYAEVDQNKKCKGFFITVFVEDMTVQEAEIAIEQLEKVNAEQGLYPKISVYKTLRDKEIMHNLMTVDPNSFSAVDRNWNVAIVQCDYD